MSYAVSRIPVYFVALVASIFIGAIIPKLIFLFGSTFILIWALIFRKEKSEKTDLEFAGFFLWFLIALEVVVFVIFLLIPDFSMDFSVYFLTSSMGRINLEVPLGDGMELRIMKQHYSALYNSFLITYLSYGALLVVIYDFVELSPNIPKKPYILLAYPWWCVLGVVLTCSLILLLYIPLPYLPKAGLLIALTGRGRS
ncbi:hypothetical protein HDIA_3973 [Hartmannibacter diazotrophicus]|uniref:Uncharacterized protein n=1 Tax=Hartmannibacter diazotrophicus TaxID=1482074 RepID=A0A2C9DB14_9HYPH|nr:hypothetical protein [Hartmannibacter diazotrophicus]SON57514.1 hypothetical protein HDIA_3973 [Hartmannibacter diazotrophicus]